MTCGPAADFDRVIVTIVGDGAKAVIVLPDPMFLANSSELIRLINEARLPVIYMETGLYRIGRPHELRAKLHPAIPPRGDLR